MAFCAFRMPSFLWLSNVSSPLLFVMRSRSWNSCILIIRACIQTFPDWADNEIRNNKHSLRIISVGFWRWCVGIERIVLLDFIHRLVSQKIEELKIYIYQISQYTRPQNSHKGQLLTTEPLTWVHTHINPWSKSDTGGNKWPAIAHFTAIKTWETQVSHTNQGTRTPTHTLVCSGWVTYCHRCLTCFKGFCVCAPR
jgi:hypothetical protein